MELGSSGRIALHGTRIGGKFNMSNKQTIKPEPEKKHRIIIEVNSQGIVEQVMGLPQNHEMALNILHGALYMTAAHFIRETEKLVQPAKMMPKGVKGLGG